MSIPSVERPTYVRHLVLAALLVITSINYIQRNSVGPAQTTIQKEFGLPDLTGTGRAASAFFWAYALCQVPAAWLAQRWGARRALSVYAAGWSLAMIACALAPGLPALIAARAVLGVFQAGIFACATLAVVAWYPPSTRGVTSALLNSFMLIGGAVGTMLTGLLLGPRLGPLDWRTVFALYALPGLVWAAWFAWWFRNRPEEHAGVNNAELAVIHEAPGSTAVAVVLQPAGQAPQDERFQPGEAPPAEGRAPQDERIQPEHDRVGITAGPLAPTEGPPAEEARVPEPAPADRGPIPWGVVLFSLPLVLLYSQQFCRAGASRFFDQWLPAYMELERGAAVDLAGVLAGLPQWAGVFGGLLGGIVSDLLLRRTRSRRVARQGVAIASLTGAVACYLLAYQIADNWMATLVFSAGFFLFACSSPCAYALTMDKGGTQLAVVFGVMNMSGNLGAATFTEVMPWLEKWTGGWSAGLLLFLGFHLVAILCWAFLDPEGSVGAPAPAKPA